MSQRIQNKPFPEYHGDIERWARDIKRHMEGMQADLVEDIKHTTQVWDDLRFPPGAVRLAPDAKPASVVDYQTGSAVEFTDAHENSITVSAQLPHTWQEGSDIEFHVHWDISSDITGVVQFDFTYTWVNIDGDMTGSDGFTSSVTLGGGGDSSQANIHRYWSIGDMTGSGKTISSMIIGTLTRDVAVADNMSANLYLLEADFHYRKDTNGSREETSK